jgi:HK97 family phage prohead protease
MSDTQFEVDNSGRIEGYGAYFGNVDSHGDVIDQGAFADTIAQAKRTGRMPAMLLHHSLGPLTEDSLPIGVWDDAYENSNGLVMKGRLALGNRRADDVYALMKTSPPALNGLSIGFIAKKFTMMPKGSDVRRKLHAVDLKEVSVVHYPSNDLARVTRVKSAASDDPLVRALRKLAETFRS